MAVTIDVRKAPLVRIRLDNPGQANQLDSVMVGELLDALNLAESSKTARAVLIEAEGDIFCAGTILTEPAQTWSPLLVATRSLFYRLMRSPLVTIASVEAAALGGGVGLAAVCDRVIVGPHATFRMTELLVGLIPALVLPIVAHRIGPHRAYSLALFAEEVSSRRAVELGLADTLCIDANSEISRSIRQINATLPDALVALKRYRADYPFEDQGADSPLPSVLTERLADPALHRRATLLRESGLMP